MHYHPWVVKVVIYKIKYYLYHFQCINFHSIIKIVIIIRVKMFKTIIFFIATNMNRFSVMFCILYFTVLVMFTDYYWFIFIFLIYFLCYTFQTDVWNCNINNQIILILFINIFLFLLNCLFKNESINKICGI